MSGSVMQLPYGGRWWRFNVRDDGRGGVDAADESVLRESWLENVYQVTPEDFKDAPVALDIGGNIGAFSIYAAALGARRVYTYEPESANFALLEANIALNGLGEQITPHRLGVDAEAREAQLVRLMGSSFIPGNKQLTKDQRAAAKAAGVESITTVTLESVFEENGIEDCGVLKVDCEGSEYGIIGTASAALLRRCRYIVMEFHGTTEANYGRMLARLSRTHNVHVFGSYARGGQLYGRRY